MKNLREGEGGWTCAKEVLGWNINREDGTVALPERKLQELNQLLVIPDTQLCIGRKELECLAIKFRSMHLAVPGVVAYLYHI